MRRRLVVVLAIAMVLSGFTIRPVGPSAASCDSPGSHGDDAQFTAAFGPGIISIAGPKTSLLPLLYGPSAPPLPVLSPPASDVATPPGTDWLPISSARRHTWLQRFRC